MTEGRIKVKNRDEEIIAKEEMKAIKESEHMMADGGEVKDNKIPEVKDAADYKRKSQTLDAWKKTGAKPEVIKEMSEVLKRHETKKPKLFADGGIVDRIRAKKGIMANNEEMPNDFDSLNEEALDFNPDSQMEGMEQASNEISPEHEPMDQHDGSLVDSIRRKMRKMIG